MRFAKRVENIQVSAIKRMPLLAREVPGAVSLGQGIPSVATPAYIRRKVSEWLETDPAIGKYSLQPGVPALKSAVAGVLAGKAGREVDGESEVFIAAGAMEALFTALVSLVDQDDEVLLFDPGYASHIEQVLFSGGRPVFVPLSEETDWSLDEGALRRAVTPRTKVIVVCNPLNPTGKVFSAAELQCIVAVAREYDLAIIADETYDFLVYDGRPFPSLLSFPEIRDRLISCYSFSKQFAMTGWRVGYMYAPPSVIDQALKVHDAAVICAPTISQYAALAALTARPDDEADIKAILQRRRDLLLSRLDRLQDLFSYVAPQGAYYVFPRYRKTQLTSEMFALRLLHEARVITIPGSAFGPSGEDHIRLSYGAAEEEIDEAFDRIELWNAKLND
jgi:aminotransferase